MFQLNLNISSLMNSFIVVCILSIELKLCPKLSDKIKNVIFSILLYNKVFT